VQQFYSTTVHVDTVVTSWMPVELARKELASIVERPVRVGRDQ
jgi:hypothetical protein